MGRTILVTLHRDTLWSRQNTVGTLDGPPDHQIAPASAPLRAGVEHTGPARPMAPTSDTAGEFETDPKSRNTHASYGSGGDTSGRSVSHPMVADTGPANSMGRRRQAVRQFGLELASGLISEPAARAWLRAPAAVEWHQPATLRRQLQQWCPPGSPRWVDPGLTARIEHWIGIIERHQLGFIGLRLEPCTALLMIGSDCERDAVALLEEWQLGVSIYSYTDQVASMQYRRKQFGEQSVVEAIAAAQQASLAAAQVWATGHEMPDSPLRATARRRMALRNAWTGMTGFLRDWL